MNSEKVERAIFAPFRSEALSLRNRLVMAPMTRAKATNGVLPDESVDYYRRRAESGVGLIISEGTWIDHPVASDRTAVPGFFGEKSLAQWKRIIEAVHEFDGKMFPQLWHVGGIVNRSQAFNPEQPSVGPSGITFDGGKPVTDVSRAMTQADIDAVVDSYGRAASDACRLGFDGIELHGGHGFLIDQFLWKVTNHRTDGYNGSIAERTRFAVEVVKECKACTSSVFPISFRFSQWKMADYTASLFNDEAELASFLEPLVDAGVDIFSCSTRQHWQPAFAGSELTLAGWTKKLSGKPTIAVGGIGVDDAASGNGQSDTHADGIRDSIAAALEQLDKGEYDLIAVGRGILADHQWPQKVREANWQGIQPFREEIRHVMY